MDLKNKESLISAPLNLHLIIRQCEGEKQINMLAGNILSIICSLWAGQHCEATLKTHYGRIQPRKKKEEGEESIWRSGAVEQ